MSQLPVNDVFNFSVGLLAGIVLSSSFSLGQAIGTDRLLVLKVSFCHIYVQ